MSTLVIKNVRFSYAHVFEPQSIDGSDNKKYSVSILIDKDDPQVTAIKDAIKMSVTEGAAKLGKVSSNLRNPLRDGDKERPDDDTYKNKFFINASCKTPPGVSKAVLVDGKYKPVKVTDSNEFYSGCYGLASVNFYAFNTSGNKGIAAGLNNVCKTKDGEFLGGRNTAETDFSEILSELPIDDPKESLF